MTFGVAVVAAGTAFMTAAAPGQAAFPGNNGLIVFSSNRPAADGSLDFEIYSMHPDGTDVRQLTNNTVIPPSSESGSGQGESGSVEAGRGQATAVDDTQPAVSPDGTKIAFVSNRPAADGSTDSEIYVMNIDGTDVRQVTNDRPGSGSGNDYEPAWSPDGTQIVYRHGDGRMADLNIVDVATGHESRVVTAYTNGPGAYDGQPSWSPDGNEIAFRKGMGKQSDIWVYDIRGPQAGDVRLLVHDPSVPESAPSFSPDGKKIVFVQGDEGSGAGIWTANADGTDAQPLTQPQPNADKMVYTDSAPRWSPDGAKIIFQSTRDGILRPASQDEGSDGGGMEGGGCGNGEQGGESFDAGNVELFVMNADGSGVAHLTVDPSTSGPKDQNPDWQTIPIPAVLMPPATAPAPAPPRGERPAARVNLQIREFACGRLLIWGSTEPRSDGEKVMVQRQTGSGWRTEATAGLIQATETRSAYWLLLGNLPAGVYRTHLVGDAAHLDGYSNVVRVRERARITLQMHRIDGTRLRLSGLVEPRHDGERIMIQQQTRTGWRTVAAPRLTGVSATRSRYEVTLRLTAGHYRAAIVGDRVHRPSVSATRVVRGTVRITLQVRALANRTVELSGTVSTGHAGEAALLQRLTHDGWRDVTTFRLGLATKAGSHYAMSFRHLAPGLYRVYMNGDAAHRLAVSGTRLVP